MRAKIKLISTDNKKTHLLLGVRIAACAGPIYDGANRDARGYASFRVEPPRATNASCRPQNRAPPIPSACFCLDLCALCYGVAFSVTAP